MICAWKNYSVLPFFEIGSGFKSHHIVCILEDDRNSPKETKLGLDIDYSCKIDERFTITLVRAIAWLNGNDINVTALKFKDQFLPFLPDDIGNSYPNLKVLSVINSGLQSINASKLIRLTFLQQINFANNSIQKIEKNSFQHNQNLFNINLSFNQIYQIDPKAFGELASLQLLSLTENICVDKIYNSILQNSLQLEKDFDENCLNQTQLVERLKELKSDHKNCSSKFDVIFRWVKKWLIVMFYSR